PIRLIKIDIQGAEILALKGAKETLAKHPDVILLLEVYPAALKEAGGSGEELLEFIRQSGFRIFLAGRTGMLEESNHQLLARCKDDGWIDIIAVRSENKALDSVINGFPDAWSETR